MEINRYKVVLIWLLFLPVLGVAQDKENTSHNYSSTKSKVYKVSDNAMIDIDNKYGDVYFSAWKKDSVKIVVKTTMKAKSSKSLNKLKERVSIDIRGNMGYVIGKTRFSKNDGSFTGTIRQQADRARQLFQTQNITVNYTVYYPESAELRVVNRYGSVYLPDAVNKLSALVSHGDIRGNTVKNAKRIEGSYGNIYFKTIETAYVVLNYGDLFLTNSDKLSLTSKSSVINIEEVGQMTIKSKSDRFVIEKAKSISGSCSYSNFIIRELESYISLNTKYGSVSLDNIGKSFKTVSLSGSYSDYILSFEDGLKCKFNLSLENSKDFSYSGVNAKINTDSTEDDIRLVSGTIGESPGNSSVNIKSKSAYVRFRQN
jgi:hypothetical protein